MLRRLESITYTLFLFLTPLLVTSFLKELFEFPKANFLYFVTGVLILLGGWRLSPKLIKRDWNLGQKLILWPLILILISNLISFAFSSSYYTSLFGYYTRFNGGLVSILCIIILVFLLLNSGFDKNSVDRLLLAVLLSGLVISVYAVLQKAGIDKGLWKEDSTSRVFSTLGQPNWLAAYLIPIFYLSLYLGFKLKTHILLKFIPALIVYFAILFTYSISGVFAFGISFLIYILLNLNNLKKWIKKYWYVFTILFFLTLAAAIPLKNRITNQVNNMSGIFILLQSDESRNFEANYGDTGKIRLILWDGTLNLITSSTKQFLIGSGPETFAYEFPKFRPDSINATSEAGFVHNKPHNWYLEIFANLGLFGFLSYLSFIAAVIFLFVRSKKSQFGMILFCGWISILVTNFFGWPTVPLSILFFLIPIFAYYENLKFKTPKQNLQIFSFIKFFPIFLLGNFLIFSSVIFVTADYFYKKGEYPTAHEINPFEPRYELFEIIYDKKFDSDRVKNLYYQNRNNPYIVKTLVSYLDKVSKLNSENTDIEEMKIEITNDAARNSPNDLQFRNIQ
jgi:O-antigen ligase